MLPDFNRVKGIHPGAILKRELKKRGIRSLKLAKEIEEFPQTINAITKERRGINAKISYKLGSYLNTDENYFMLLQAAYEVSLYKKMNHIKNNPLRGKFRSSLFWDTRIEYVDYEKNKRSIIQRVLERGNEKEIKNLIDIYTISLIRKEVKKIKNSNSPRYQGNLRLFINK